MPGGSQGQPFSAGKKGGSMFGEENNEAYTDGALSGLLEKGCAFEGKLNFEGTVRINGKFSGEIFSEGTLIIGEGAKVDAKVEAGTVIIHGEISGSITAKERIEMHAPAVVTGEISAKTLVIDEQVIFEGTCKMGRKGQLHSVELAQETQST
jgi:cytoskeletal protein CcmA (bactofilin family)